MGLICILRFGQDWLCVAPCLLNVLSEECKAIKRPVWVYLHNASSPCMACVSGGGGSGVITNQRQSGRTRNNNWEFTPKLWLVTGAISLSLSLSSAWLSHNECEWSDLFSKGHDWLDLFFFYLFIKLIVFCILKNFVPKTQYSMRVIVCRKLFWQHFCILIFWKTTNKGGIRLSISLQVFSSFWQD